MALNFGNGNPFVNAFNALFTGHKHNGGLNQGPKIKHSDLTEIGTNTHAQIDTAVAKLATIDTDADVNVQSDWNATNGYAFIQNKPTIPDELADLSDDATHRLVTDTEKSTWNVKQDALAFIPANVDKTLKYITIDDLSLLDDIKDINNIYYVRYDNITTTDRYSFKLSVFTNHYDGYAPTTKYVQIKELLTSLEGATSAINEIMYRTYTTSLGWSSWTNITALTNEHNTSNIAHTDIRNLIDIVNVSINDEESENTIYNDYIENKVYNFTFSYYVDMDIVEKTTKLFSFPVYTGSELKITQILLKDTGIKERVNNLGSWSSWTNYLTAETSYTQTQINAITGITELTSLTTEDKTSVINAINELELNQNAIALYQSELKTGIDIFLHEETSAITNYHIARDTPDTTVEQIETVSVTNQESLIRAWAFNAPFGTTTLRGGAWHFVLFGKVSSVAAGTSNLVVRVYKRTTGGVETELFNATSSALTTTVSEHSVETVQPDFAVDATDLLIIKIFGKTTSASARTVSFYYEGSANYSHIHTPLASSSYFISKTEKAIANGIATLNANSKVIQEPATAFVKQLPFYTYTHTANKSAIISAIDLTTNIFTSANHAFIDGDIVWPLPNSNAGAVYPPNVYPTGIVPKGFPGYYVKKIDANTFELHSVVGLNAIVDITAVGDLTKWHFETRTLLVTLTGLPSLRKYKLKIYGQYFRSSGSGVIITPNNLTITNSIKTGSNIYTDAGIFSGGDIYVSIDIDIDFTTHWKVKYEGYKVQSNTNIANTATNIDIRLIDKVITPQNITSLKIDEFNFANGTVIEVYEI